MPAPVPILAIGQFLDGGGSERQLRQTLRALDKSRFETHVAFFHRSPQHELALSESGVRTVHIPLTSFKRWSAVQAAQILRRYLRDHRIQLLHAWDPPSVIFSVPVARLAGVPVILTSLRGHRNLISPGTRRLQQLVEHLSDAIIVNAPALAAAVEREDHIPHGKIRICPNGLETSLFRSSDRERPPELASATAVVGCVAAQRKEKHLPFLIDAFASLRLQRPGVKLLLVGSGPESDAIREHVKAVGVAEDTVLIPHTPDPAPWLRAIDIFVLTSESEGTSNSLMEAMACGCAVVASNVPGTRDLVQDGQNGFLFEFQNQPALVSRLCRLIDDEPARTAIGARASAWIHANMSLEASAARMGAIYDEFLRIKYVA